MKIIDEHHVTRNKLKRKPIVVKRPVVTTPENKFQVRKFYAKRNNAKKKGIIFDLEFSDIQWPTHCPVLGMKLTYGTVFKKGHCRHSASFDRIDPAKGYVKGNIIIVSMQANAIKQDVGFEDILKVGNFYKELKQSIDNTKQ